MVELVRPGLLQAHVDLRDPKLESEPKSSGFNDPSATQSPLTRHIDVAWGEMDSLGHVNNIYYLRWIESVRFHYFNLVGLGASLRGDQVGPILGGTAMCYKRPVTFPDRIEVSTCVVSLSHKSFVMQNRLWSQAQDALVGYGQSTIVMVDYRNGGQSTQIPPAVRAAIETLENMA